MARHGGSSGAAVTSTDKLRSVAPCRLKQFPRSLRVFPTTAPPIPPSSAADCSRTELERHADTEDDFFKRNAYRKAIPAVRNCKFRITSVSAAAPGPPGPPARQLKMGIL